MTIGQKCPLSGRFKFWFDNGVGGVWIYGDVLSRGNVFLTVLLENGRKQRVRIGSAAHEGMYGVREGETHDNA